MRMKARLTDSLSIIMLGALMVILGLVLVRIGHLSSAFSLFGTMLLLAGTLMVVFGLGYLLHRPTEYDHDASAQPSRTNDPSNAKRAAMESKQYASVAWIGGFPDNGMPVESLKDREN